MRGTAPTCVFLLLLISLNPAWEEGSDTSRGLDCLGPRPES